MLEPFSQSSPKPLALFEQVRQRLQLHLGVTIRTRSVTGRFYPAGSQLWQIGSGPYLLAMNPAAAPAAREPAGQQALLLYDYVPPQLAEHLRTQGTNYADAAGNTWLRHPPLLVNVQGCPRSAAVTRPAATISTARQINLLRVLFQLMQPPLLSHCVLTLAAHTGLSLAAVQQVKAHLVELGLWPAASAAGWPTQQLAQATHYWLAGFAPFLRRRLNPQRYCLRDPALWTDWPRAQLPAGCWWGGESAAHLLLKRPDTPATLTLYSRVPRPKLIEQLHLIPHARGPVEVLNALAPTETSTAAQCVSPLLVYADLLAGSFPSQALAQELRTKLLSF